MVERSSIPGLPAAVAARRELAAELRALHAATGLAAQHVGDEVGFSAAKISRIEAAHIPVKPADLKELLRVYHVDQPTTGAYSISPQQPKAPA
jgi:Helix-turn-helix domain